MGTGLDIGVIGLPKMGQPMARRLIEAGYRLVIHDTRCDAAAPRVALGATGPASPVDVADNVGTVSERLTAADI